MSEAVATTPLYTVRRGAIEADTWQRFVPNDGPLPHEPGNWLVPLEVWLQHAADLRERGMSVGVLLSPDDDVQALAGHLDGLALIAVDFPAFTDGRGFSSGYLVRTRLGWQGEMRAVGDVLIDIVHYLARCGFDSFTLKPGHDPKAALRQFNAFSVHYQRQYANPAGAGAAA